MTPYGPVLTFR